MYLMKLDHRVDMHYSVDMYLRKSSRKNKDGSIVYYYHLAHNIRHPDSNVSTPHNVYNFGRADKLDLPALERLCKSIARVCGLSIEGSERFSENHFANEAGLPETIELIETVELGVPMVIQAIWEKLGIGEALRKAAEISDCKVPYERALFAMTANKLCESESKFGIWDRWLKKVYLPSCQNLKLAQMYEAMDLLHKHCAEVEKAVFFNTANLFNLEVDVVFYDTTTASFSIDYADEDEEDSVGLRKFGHPKEGGWAPQVVVALAVTRDGFPVRSWVFPGNTSDVTTIKKVRDDLRDWKLGRTLFTGDSGMNSEETRKELARAGGKYLLATRMGSVKEIKETVLSRPGRYKVINNNLHAKEIVVGDGARQRRYILCYNPIQAKRESQHREKVIKDLEEKMRQHPEKTATAQWAIELKASGRYGRYLSITKKGSLEINRKSIREAARYDGKWVVQTNDDTITPEDAACGYKSLLVIERCFRSLKKTQIKMMPMFHWVANRIEAHVKICVLALLVERVIEKTCGKPWSKIRETLQTLQASRFYAENFQFFQRNEPSLSVIETLKNLGIKLPKRILAVIPHS